MSFARQIISGSIYLITRRCSERRHFLAPQRDVDAIFSYLLAALLERHGLELLGAVQMSNHYHALVHDPEGHVPAFMRDFHMLVARSVNRLRRRSDGFWGIEQASLVEVVDGDAVVDILAYMACNPVAAGLVRRGTDWPGLRTSPYACTQRPLVLQRPQGFLRADGPLPPTATLRVVVAPTHRGLTPHAFAALVASRVADKEAALVRELEARGHRFPSLRTLASVDWSARPTTASGLFSLSPLVSARHPDRRLKTLERIKRFQSDYATARQRFVRGARNTIFPGGTWMYPRIHGLKSHPPPIPAWASA
jgi:putative transposase